MIENTNTGLGRGRAWLGLSDLITGSRVLRPADLQDTAVAVLHIPQRVSHITQRRLSVIFVDKSNAQETMNGADLLDAN